MAYRWGRNLPFRDEKIFNMDQLFTERIDRRLEQLDISTVTGDQTARYRLLQTIFIDTHFKYIDRTPHIKEEFREVKKLLKTPISSVGRTAQAQHTGVIISLAEEKLDTLHFKIVGILYEVDLICLKKPKQKPPEEEVEVDY